MNKYWSPRLSGLEPYIPGEQPKDKKYIKLNTNENPYPPSPMALEAIRNTAGEDMRLYPDPECLELKKVIAENYGLKTEQIFTGNGSDEVLAFSFMAFFASKEKILFPDISYSFYPVYAEFLGISYETIPLDDEFNIQADKFCQPNGGIIFPNPNAPTGKAINPDEIEKILKGNPDNVVIVDEAYVDFGADSAVSLINKYPNLLVVQTFSKSRSLAGLRVGYAMGDAELISGLICVKDSINSYTLDRAAVSGAAAAMKDKKYFEESRRKVINTRERFVESLNTLGFHTIESKANFVFTTHHSIQAEILFKMLRDKGILVRYFNKPRIDNYLRISIGKDEDMDTLVKVLGDIVK